MAKKVLLIGNDINNATPGYSWEDLLNNLIGYAKLEKKLSRENKPFPLLYEEIFLSSAKLRGTKESRIKLYIGVLIRKLIPNKIHKQILDLNISDILTTNYDSTLEEVLMPDTKKLKNSGVIKESLYSLFRKNVIGDYNFWHIHGYERIPSTITLGYEHYGGYLQQMRNYVVSGTKGTYKKNFIALSRRIKDGLVTHESWIDFFFTHDVHILALNLDFIEIHIWWLLTYRARAKILKKLPITNNIYYYYPSKFEKTSLSKLQLLRVNDIQTISIEMTRKDRLGYYKKVLTKIKNSN